MMRKEGDNAGDAPEANWDKVKSFMLFWLLLAKEGVTWKKLAFLLQPGSNGQKSSWSKILGAPPEEYMVGVLHETNNQLTSEGMLEAAKDQSS